MYALIVNDNMVIQVKYLVSYNVTYNVADVFVCAVNCNTNKYLITTHSITCNIVTVTVTAQLALQ